MLFEKRKKVSDYALIMALFGIFMMIIENELTSASIFSKVSFWWISFCLTFRLLSISLSVCARLFYY